MAKSRKKLRPSCLRASTRSSKRSGVSEGLDARQEIRRRAEAREGGEAEGLQADREERRFFEPTNFSSDIWADDDLRDDDEEVSWLEAPGAPFCRKASRPTTPVPRRTRTRPTQLDALR